MEKKKDLYDSIFVAKGINMRAINRSKAGQQFSKNGINGQSSI